MATAAVKKPKPVRLCSECYVQETNALQQISLHNLANSNKFGWPVKIRLAQKCCKKYNKKFSFHCLEILGTSAYDSFCILKWSFLPINSLPPFNWKSQLQIARNKPQLSRTEHRKVKPKHFTSVGLSEFCHQLTVQTARFIVMLDPSRAALIDSLTLQSVNLLVNCVVPRPLKRVSLREHSTSIPVIFISSGIKCTYVIFTIPFFQPLTVVVKNETHSKTHPDNIQCCIMSCPRIFWLICIQGSQRWVILVYNQFGV